MNTGGGKTVPGTAETARSAGTAGTARIAGTAGTAGSAGTAGTAGVVIKLNSFKAEKRILHLRLLSAFNVMRDKLEELLYLRSTISAITARVEELTTQATHATISRVWNMWACMHGRTAHMQGAYRPAYVCTRARTTEGILGALFMLTFSPYCAHIHARANAHTRTRNRTRIRTRTRTRIQKGD